MYNARKEGVVLKKVTVIITALTVLFLLTSCSAKTYDEGYEEGYNDGYSDAELELEEQLLDWYEIGYDDGQMDGKWLEYEASDYARKHTGWIPEEAVMIIDAYHSGAPFWPDGSPPSHNDYLDAIETLARFYEYFFCRLYK